MLESVLRSLFLFMFRCCIYVFLGLVRLVVGVYGALKLGVGVCVGVGCICVPYCVRIFFFHGGGAG